MIHCVVDIGNTYTKIAFFDNRELTKTDVFSNADDIKVHLASNQIDYSIVSSVGNDDLTKFVIACLVDPIELNAGTNLPIENKYKTPLSLGKDRIANAVAAYHLFNNTNSLVIDAGTCLKFDFINESNQYLGGVISPGLKMRFKALHTFTDKLPLVSPTDSNPVEMGVSTLTSIHAGCFTGMNNEIEATITHYRAKFGDIKILMTGGDLEELQKMEFSQKNSIFADRWLTLRGLNEILHYNIDQ